MINPSQHKPTGLPPPPPPAPAPDDASRIAWITKVRGMHRYKRFAGFIGCILGAAVLLWAKYSPDQAPAWAMPVGFAVVGVCWLLFVFVIWDRWRWVRANPYKPGAPPK
jgi:hypothetical protein